MSGRGQRGGFGTTGVEGRIGLTHRLEAAPLAAAAHEICVAFGLELKSAGEIPADVTERAAALDAARAAKDFATADSLRAALQNEGWIVETTKSGTSVRR